MTEAQEEWRGHLTEQQLEWISEQTRRAAGRAVRKWARGAVVGFLILCVGSGVAISRTAGIDDLNARSHQVCERLNIVRAQSNVSDSVSFNILSQSARREDVLADLDTNRGIHRESATTLAREAGRLTVTDLTDCDAAQHPDYDYPVAGPVGDPTTGELNVGVATIVAESEALLRRVKRDRKDEDG